LGCVGWGFGVVEGGEGELIALGTVREGREYHALFRVHFVTCPETPLICHDLAKIELHVCVCR
jgi:hypothetical protein